MFRKVALPLFTLLLVSCLQKNKTQTTVSVSEDNSTELKTYDFKGITPILHPNDGKIHVINFWATWCRPCVAELPYFERLTTEYASKNVMVTLISMDLPSQIESKLIPFIKEHQLKSNVVVLDDPDANNWISKVDPNWSGSIPATIITDGTKNTFYEQSFDYESLEKVLKEFSL